MELATVGGKKTQIKINKFIYLKWERDERAEETLVAGGRRSVFNFGGRRVEEGGQW
jgi:hypothetical protein